MKNDGKFLNRWSIIGSILILLAIVITAIGAITIVLTSNSGEAKLSTNGNTTVTLQKGKYTLYNQYEVSEFNHDEMIYINENDLQVSIIDKKTRDSIKTYFKKGSAVYSNNNLKEVGFLEFQVEDSCDYEIQVKKLNNIEDYNIILKPSLSLAAILGLIGITFTFILFMFSGVVLIIIGVIKTAKSNVGKC